MALKRKLIFGFLAVCLGLFVVAYTGYASLRSVVAQYERLADVVVPKLGDISGMRARAAQVRAESTRLVLFWGKPAAAEAHKALQKGLSRYQEIDAEFRARGFSSPEEKATYEAMAAEAAGVIAFGEKILSAHGSAGTNAAALRDSLVAAEKQTQLHQKLLKDLDDKIVEAGEVWSAAAGAAAASASRWLIVMAGITSALAIAFSLVLAHHISKVLTGVANALTVAAEGVFTGCERLRQMSAKLSENTHEQVASVEETVAATEQIASMIQKTASNTESSLTQAEESRTLASEGQRSVRGAVEAITSIVRGNQELAAQLERNNEETSGLVQLIGEIDQKTRVINDIVFQTKLLSFNASVEAARAGEHGKGFAVVAEEVGTLAVSSGRSAKEISDLLQASSSQVAALVQRARESVRTLLQASEKRIEEGRSTTEHCSASFESLASGMERILEFTKEISLAMNEQSTGIQEINKAMQEVGNSATRNATTSQDCADMSYELQANVERIRSAVHELSRTIHGRAKAELAAAELGQPAESPEAQALPEQSSRAA